MVNSTLAGRTIWLVRHGESTWNRLGLCQGHNDDAELTDRGRGHAQRVDAALRAEPVGTIFVSDLRRAVQTATPLAGTLGIPLYPDVRLRERSLGVMEGGPLSAVGSDVTGIRDDIVLDPDTRPSGGESLRDFHGRAAAFCAELAARAERGALAPGDVVIVAHGGTLRMLNACLTGISVDQMSWMPVPNGTILRVCLEQDDLARREHS
jgi:2,3-bisphosphoglycerate-dependent phosphoglycerate mutase